MEVIREEEKEIVIVGGGICGLATALALHRKGISSLVLERSDSLRAEGAAITIMSNGWIALDFLGVGSQLRPTSLNLDGHGVINLDQGPQLKKTRTSEGEYRCLRRNDVVKALVRDLPPGTVRFGCHVKFVKSDPLSSCPVIHLKDGSTIKAKVLLGCEGVNSVVSDYLGMRPTQFSNMAGIRGFTNYPEGQSIEKMFVIRRKGKGLIGRAPVSDTLVYWFIGRLWTPEDVEIQKSQELIHRSSMETIKDFPEDIREMVKNCDRCSLSCRRTRYRAPWDVLMGSFNKGTAAVAGDALHAMTPFIGQGGSACLEDAIALAEFLAQKQGEVGLHGHNGKELMGKYEEALDSYVKHRRMRLFIMSIHAYLLTKLTESPYKLVKFFCVLLMLIFFPISTIHADYDCRPPLTTRGVRKYKRQ